MGKLTAKQKYIINSLKLGAKIFYWCPEESINNKWGACIEFKDGKIENVRISFLQKMWANGLLQRTETMQYVL